MDEELGLSGVADAALIGRISRRGFLARLGSAPALVAGGSLLGTAALNAGAAQGTSFDRRRAQEALKLRIKLAVTQRLQPEVAYPVNGDEERYANYIGNFSKALPHGTTGEVDRAAYQALLRAMRSGDPADFEAIPLGGSLKLADPQAAYAYQLEGADAHALSMPAPPEFASEAQAGEMVELYWQALARDVPFSQYGHEPITAAALTDLRQFANFAGTQSATLFRANTPGEAIGPYISQFLYQDVPFGAMTIAQKYITPMVNQDFMKTPAEWMSIQNGSPPLVRSAQSDSAARYLRNGRDLAEYVHRDFSYQAFLNAAQILLGMGALALDDANPYKQNAKQGGFVTFGGPDILSMVAQVAHYALKAAWFQKWSIHRRARPEEFAGRVHQHLLGAQQPIHAKLLNSQALQQILRQTHAAYLPMAYPEGCPCHPAYPAGHAVIAGACGTVLKAFFNEAHVFGEVRQPTDDGLAWQAYTGPALSVGGELNKLAANISIGRDIAGVHWQSDGIEGMKLGEAVAIAYLKDVKATYNERFVGFRLGKFNGASVTI